MNTARPLFLFILFITCGVSYGQTREETGQVVAVYNEIAAIVSKGKIDELGRFIHPETGVIEIIDPEGVPYPLHHTDIGMAKLQGLFISVSTKTPEDGLLPEFDCNIGMWTRTGTFISPVKGYPLLNSILEDAAEVTYIDKRMLSVIKFLSENISFVVMTTDESVLGFFKKEGVWWLGLVDNSFHCVE